MTALEIAMAGYLALPQSATGRDLMERGLAVTLSGDYDSAVFEVCKMEQSK